MFGRIPPFASHAAAAEGRVLGLISQLTPRAVIDNEGRGRTLAPMALPGCHVPHPPRPWCAPGHWWALLGGTMLAMTALIVITGAAGALGRAVVDEFVTLDAVVAAMDQAGPRLDALAQQDRVHPVPVDLTDPAEVATAWEQVDSLGATAALVCIAGAFTGGGLEDTEPGALDAMLSVNLATALWSCRAAAPRMRAAGGGSIVTIGSRAGVSGDAPVAYAAAKAALIRASEVLAGELRADRIRVNCVLPSVIDTPANRSWMSADAVARAVSPAAIARVVAFLCSDAAAPISGAAIPVYGDA